LSQNYPNPFSPLVRGSLGTSSTTLIRFTLPTRTAVKLAIYNARGSLIRELADQQIYKRGEAELVWDGTNIAGLPVSSGIYFYRLEARDLESDESFSQTRKILLVR